MNAIENVLAHEDPCPRYQQALNTAVAEYQGNETIADKELYDYLSYYMNETVSDPITVGEYYTTMVIEDNIGYTLPNWTMEVYPDKMRDKAESISEAIFSTKYLQKMVGGPMLQELLHQFNEKSCGDNGHRKLLVYSAHDYTVAGTWIALGMKGSEIFPAYFGTALVFELHKTDDDKHFVRMFRYNDTTMVDPYEISIPDCGKLCPLSVLFNITNYMRSADPVEDCIINS